MSTQTKVLVLLSGGLDSMLAVKLLQLQEIEVVGVCFESNFFNADKARIAAKKLNIELKVIDLRKEELDLVKNPPNGYGKNLNPCIDCHGLMINKTNEILKKEGFDIIATGEVSGQRPFSQTHDSLKKVVEVAGTEVLRPLSAKNLEETDYEKRGLINRDRLLNINGRSRERQMELARKYNIKEYPSPAGGCLLTDPEFSQRLLKMFDYWPECTVEDVELLKYGRVFWFNLENNKKIIAVIGRHKKDNEALEKLAKKGDIMLELEDIAGPLTLLRTRDNKLEIKDNILQIEIPEVLKLSELELGEVKKDDEVFQITSLFTGYYATKARGKKVKIKINIK